MSGILEYVVLFLAGWGAGTVTGLIGASAIVVVAPILVTFLGFGAYQAIGVSLTTDVFASLTAASTYSTHGNINIKSGIQIAVLAVIGALIGSWISAYVPSGRLGGLTGVAIILSGISFLRKPITLRAKEFQEIIDLSFFRQREILSSAFFGFLIGLICGIFGAGGGVMILIVLVFILSYQIHTAIGTSVLIMMFTALSGAVGHMFYGPFPLYAAAISVVGGIFGALFAAKFANLSSEERLARVVGGMFLILGIILVVEELFL